MMEQYDDDIEVLPGDLRDQAEREDYEDEEIEMRTARERTSSEGRVSDQEWEEEKSRREEEEFLEEQERNLREINRND